MGSLADEHMLPWRGTWRVHFYIAVQSSFAARTAKVQQQRIVEIAVSSQYAKVVKHTKQVYCAYIELGIARSETVQKLR